MKTIGLILTVVLTLLLCSVGPVMADDPVEATIVLSVTIVPPSGGGGGGGEFGDNTSPRIYDLSVQAIGETVASIHWRTNERSTSQVEYWASPSTLSPVDRTRVLYHTVNLSNLIPGTTYHYKARSRDAAGNLAKSEEGTFATLEEPEPDLVAVFSIDSLFIYPREVSVGETVEASVLVTNSGGAVGSYEVVLLVDGINEGTRPVTLGAYTGERVAFTISRGIGNYSVSINGLEGSFEVKEVSVPIVPEPVMPEPVPSGGVAWWIWTVAGIIVAASLGAWWLLRRGKKSEVGT